MLLELPVADGSLRFLPWLTRNGRVAGAITLTVPWASEPATKVTVWPRRVQVPTMFTSASGIEKLAPLASVWVVLMVESESW